MSHGVEILSPVEPALAPVLSDDQQVPVGFGRNVQGTSSTRSFVISNTSAAELLISGLTVPPGYTALNLPVLPLTIASGQSITFQISLSTLAAERRKPRELGRICRIIDDICFNRKKGLLEDEMALGYSLFEQIAAATQNRVYTLVFVTLSQVFRNIRIALAKKLPEDKMSTEDLLKLREAFERADKAEVGEIISRWLNVMEDALKPFTVSEDGL